MILVMFDFWGNKSWLFFFSLALEGPFRTVCSSQRKEMALPVELPSTEPGHYDSLHVHTDTLSLLAHRADPKRSSRAPTLRMSGFPQACMCVSECVCWFDQTEASSGGSITKCKFLCSPQYLSKHLQDRQMSVLISKQIPLLMQLWDRECHLWFSFIRKYSENSPQT